MELWIARDLADSLWLFDYKPQKDKDIIFEVKDEKGNMLNIMRLPYNIFPEVTFENSPQKVKIELIKE